MLNDQKVITMGYDGYNDIRRCDIGGGNISVSRSFLLMLMATVLGFELGHGQDVDEFVSRWLMEQSTMKLSAVDYQDNLRKMAQFLELHVLVMQDSPVNGATKSVNSKTVQL